MVRRDRNGTPPAAMLVDAFLGGFAQVVPEVPSVGDLEGLWGTEGGAFGEKGGTVAADIPSR
ncbi:hypothetical protein GCM10018775_80970 [Streptomyces umbrinus]|nr:hypothetical protein GCM10018775_80970 [Streptomyces umbrinus]